MNPTSRLTRFERCLTLLTRVESGDGRRIGILALQAFTLMVGYYLIRPVREALILTEGTAELRSYAVGVQAVILILILPAYGALVGRVKSNRVFQFVIAFFALNLVIFFLVGHSGVRFSFLFFVWASIFAVMAVMAGLRAAICRMAVPRRMRYVTAPSHARGTTASEPYASAVHTEW